MFINSVISWRKNYSCSVLQSFAFQASKLTAMYSCVVHCLSRLLSHDFFVTEHISEDGGCWLIIEACEQLFSWLIQPIFWLTSLATATVSPVCCFVYFGPNNLVSNSVSLPTVQLKSGTVFCHMPPSWFSCIFFFLNGRKRFVGRD